MQPKNICIIIYKNSKVKKKDVTWNEKGLFEKMFLQVLPIQCYTRGSNDEYYVLFLLNWGNANRVCKPF